MLLRFAHNKIFMMGKIYPIFFGFFLWYIRDQSNLNLYTI